MKDRQPTKVLANGAIRYGIYREDGTLDHYEYIKREDAPTVEGTPLNKANLLSDATAAKIWPNAEARPEDPTVNDAFSKLAQGTAKVGDIEITARTDLSNVWLPCDGRYISEDQYPELFETLRVSASAAPWSAELLPPETVTGYSHPTLSNANGYWFYAVNGHLYYSADLVSWTNITPSDLSRYSSSITGLHYAYEVHYWQERYVCLALIETTVSAAPYVYMCLYTDQLQQTGWKLAYIADMNGTSINNVSESNRTLLFDGTTYYFDYYAAPYSGTAHTHHVYHTTALSEISDGQFRTPWPDLTGISDIYYAKYYDATSGYFYGAKIENHTDIRGIARTRSLQSSSGWNNVSIQGASKDIRAFAVDGNNIAVTTYTSSKDQIYRSTDMGETFTALLTTTELQNRYFSQVALVSGIICAWSGNGDEWICIIDAGSTDVQIVSSDTLTADAFAVHGNTIAICSYDYVSILHQDFTHSKKKIPNITPDSRSHAYIKALEE